ncbi:MAG: 16S rRNA (guanine(527)-N(7))-methyltransferase RsmG [Candidatus Zixiibacteriota bacterium]
MKEKKGFAEYLTENAILVPFNPFHPLTVSVSRETLTFISPQMFSSEQVVILKSLCSSFGIKLSKDMIDKFQAYSDLLLNWNKRINLVSKRDATSDRIIRHFIDSLSIFKSVDIPKTSRILDIGSGAGFPAIPIKIVREDIHTALLESIHKKTLFLKKLIEVLKLEEINIINDRAENVSLDENFRDKFDFVTLKAFGDLQAGIKLALPFLKIGGCVVFYKGKRTKNEIRGIKPPVDYKIEDIDIPEINLARCLVILRKI